MSVGVRVSEEHAASVFGVKERRCHLQVSLKRCCLSTRLHGVASHNTAVFVGASTLSASPFVEPCFFIGCGLLIVFLRFLFVVSNLLIISLIISSYSFFFMSVVIIFYWCLF